MVSTSDYVQSTSEKLTTLVCPQFKYRSYFLGDFFKYLRICTIVFQWVVLGVDRNWLTTLTTNAISDL